jgi:hypothetical protein
MDSSRGRIHTCLRYSYQHDHLLYAQARPSGSPHALKERTVTIYMEDVGGGVQSPTFSAPHPYAGQLLRYDYGMAASKPTHQ